jgi:hypothetical protein
MKTVRYNTYETNSSSTHAYTVRKVDHKNRPDLNIIPDDDGFIRVGFSEMSESTPQDKIGHILKYANSVGDQEMFDRVRKTVEEFTGAKLLISTRIWKDGKYETVEDMRVVSNPKFNFNDEDEDEDTESLTDEWYSYTNEYGHGSIGEFCEVMNEIGRTEKNLKIFIFSSKQGVYVESYYS